MQYGNLTKQARKHGPAVWAFRWWEAGANGNRVRRSMILGTVKDFGNQAAARRAVAGLLREINSSDRRFHVRPITKRELVAHYSMARAIGTRARHLHQDTKLDERPFQPRAAPWSLRL